MSKDHNSNPVETATNLKTILQQWFSPVALDALGHPVYPAHYASEIGNGRERPDLLNVQAEDDICLDAQNFEHDCEGNWERILAIETTAEVL